MIVITGATGHTGRVAAEILLAKGEKVRVLGRSAAKLLPLTTKGAEASRPPLRFRTEYRSRGRRGRVRQSASSRGASYS